MMRKILPVVVFFVAFLVLSGLSVAQSTIWFFDLQRIIRESKAGKEAQAELKTFSQEKGAVLQNERKKLEEQQKKIAAVSPIGPEAEQLRKDYQGSLDEFTKLRDQTEAQVKQKDRELTRRIAQEVKDIVAEMTKEKGIEYVFEMSGSSVVIFPPGSDVTEEIIKRYDNRYKAKATQ